MDKSEFYALVRKNVESGHPLCYGINCTGCPLYNCNTAIVETEFHKYYPYIDLHASQLKHLWINWFIFSLIF